MWKPDLEAFSGPRYIAIADAIAQGMESGQLSDGERLPTHRALADTLGVTVGTITRAYAEAERRGLVTARVGRGTFIAGSSQSPGFYIPEQPEPDRFDLSLNLPVAKNRANLLGPTLAELAAEPATLNRLLNYQPDTGMPEHRAAAAQWLQQRGMPAEPEQIIITSGGQNAILLSLMALTRPGDMILAEAMTYPGLMAITHQLNLRPQPVAMDEQGLIPEAFEDACKQFSPRVLYCNPTLQNPTNTLMPAERRRQLLEIARRYHVWIIEDAVNTNLMAEPPEPLACMAPDQVVYINSAAKVMAAGLRVGWIVAPETIYAQIAHALRACNWMTSPMLAEISSRWIRSGLADTLQQKQQQEIRARNALAAQYLSAYDVRIQPESLHAWLILPSPWRSRDFVQEAERQGVQLVGEEKFVVAQHRAPQAIRLSVSCPWSRAHLEKGLQLLTELLHQEPAPSLSVF